MKDRYSRAMRSMSPELARSALDAAPDAMVVIDSEGTIRYANQQTATLFGYGHDEILGRCVDELLPERLRSRHIAHRQGYVRNPRPRPMGAGLELFGCRRDGSEFPVEISLSPIDDAAGQTLVAAAIRDISERKRIEIELATQFEDLRRLHELSTRLIEASDLPGIFEEILGATMAVQRADFGNIQLYDPVTATLKIAAQRGFSLAFLQHFSAVDSNDMSTCGRALRTWERVIIPDVEADPEYLPHRMIAAQEGYRAVQSTPIRGRDGTLMGVFSTHFRAPHRPTDRELQLTDIYMGLVADFITRAQAEERIRDARDRADRANQAKSRFLATASHDLRQPVQSLALLNGTLRRITDDADVLEVIGQQEVAVGAMSRLLNTLLDISRLESGAIRPDPSDFEVAALFEELRREFRSVAAGKGLQLQVQSIGAAAVRSDRALVEQILRNLLSNAIKYTRHGIVRLDSHAQGMLVRIEVADTGIGIPADQLPYIYDEFYQISSPGRPRSGYGLGLSIVQRLVSLLGVRLEVQSEPGKGSSFALHLPSGAAAASTRRASTADGAAKRPLVSLEPRVLLVEDEEAVRRATRMLLRVEGYQVREAASLEEALTAIEQYGSVDVLITDYHLGAGQNGSDVIEALRERLGAALPAVLTSGDTSAAIRELPRDPRVRVTSKPVRADELIALLRELLTAETH